ncbi:MAG: SdpI family protein [Acutalibacter sp.]|nr:SdpI family protein [Acutalibacter sp.]
MLKKNKWKLLLSSLVVLLPMAVGLILWDSLPTQMAFHWGLNGEADNWSNSIFPVVILPLVLLVFHWVAVLVTLLDPKNKNQTKKAIGLIFWIVPLISLLLGTFLYVGAFRIEFNVGMLVPAVLGLTFIVIGNYMPKCKQNHTLGIKIKWTLENEENWNATHRFAGKVWVAGGLILLLCCFLPIDALPVVVLIAPAALVVPPVVYSYRYHRKQLKMGVEAVKTPETREGRKAKIAALCIVGVVLLLCSALLFTGNITMRYDDASFTVQATYWGDLTVEYNAVDSIEYLDEKMPGTRAMGFFSPKLQMGTYLNEEYGSYTRYTYTGCDACVVLSVSGRTLVLNGADQESTQAIYQELSAKIN